MHIRIMFLPIWALHRKENFAVEEWCFRITVKLPIELHFSNTKTTTHEHNWYLPNHHLQMCVCVCTTTRSASMLGIRADRGQESFVALPQNILTRAHGQTHQLEASIKSLRTQYWQFSRSSVVFAVTFSALWQLASL